MIGVMKMIDEKKLIEELETMIADVPISYVKDENHDRLNAYLHALSRVISNVKRQPKVNEWIPIEERLPEEKGLYLVAYHPCYWDNVKEDVLVGIDNFTGKTSWSRRKYQRVIAWMPLPDPYKGSENNDS